jgi:glycosyltransferase-like protein
MSRPLRIAMLSHSTNPRGGVVHAMQLSEALTALGHEVVLHAPDAKGKGFFRTATCGTTAFPVAPAEPEMTAMVEQRIADYICHFEHPAARDFDVFHAHDGISGNALATLQERGLITAFARTVHHIDTFTDPRLMDLQDRSIDQASAFFAVSAMWQQTLKHQRNIDAKVVGNGVDTNRFAPIWNGDQAALRDRLGLHAGPVFLSIGGVEARKNTIGILDAFRQLRAVQPDAQLMIAGGVSLLDHHDYQVEFQSHLRSLGADGSAVHLVGAIADSDMPSLYRLADALAFPSLKEGFGLVVLEAMASGVPAIVPSIAPFTEYLSGDDAIWCDPRLSASIAQAMALSLLPEIRNRVIARGLEVASRFSWSRVADAHLHTYATLKEAANA